MSDDDERSMRDHAQTESEAVADQLRNSTALEKAYPETEPKKIALRRYVARLLGKAPDGYDVVPALVWFERLDNLESMADAQLRHEHLNGEAKFDFERALSNRAIEYLLDLTVSMGGGKGRREDVELGKTSQATGQPSRWALRRRE